MAFSSVTWGSVGDWLSCACFRKPTESRSEALLRCMPVAEELGICEVSGGGPRASSAREAGPGLSRRPLQTSPQAGHLSPSVFALLGLCFLLTVSTSTTAHASTAPGNTRCLRLPEIPSPHRTGASGPAETHIPWPTAGTAWLRGPPRLGLRPQHCLRGPASCGSQLTTQGRVLSLR